MQERLLRDSAPALLRFALSGVFLWFGISQLKQASDWVGFVPEWATTLSGMSADFLVRMNGIMEVVLGTLLTLGLFVRPVAFLLSAHLFVIAWDLGASALGVRDYGLAFATLAVAMHGQDRHCLFNKDIS